MDRSSHCQELVDAESLTVTGFLEKFFTRNLPVFW
jgi:hypothetical protein